MKTLITLILTVTLTFSATVFAHSGGHDNISGGNAVSIAHTSAKMLTVKDHGMAIGKLDESWSKVERKDYYVAEQNARQYIVKATNKANGQTLFFTISKEGQLQDIADQNSFKSAHGHSH